MSYPLSSPSGPSGHSPQWQPHQLAQSSAATGRGPERAVAAADPDSRLSLVLPRPLPPAENPGIEEEPAPPWFEQVIPDPLNDIGPSLEPDDVLKKTLQDAEAGRRFYDEQVSRRQALEEAGKGDEYTFEPFMVLLGNMKTVAAHIAGHRHFHERLTADEKDAFDQLQVLIQEMIDLKAPYKRTVQLATLMTTMLEILTVRHELDGLKAVQELRDRHRFAAFPFHRQADRQESRGTPLKTADISLQTVLSCRWGTLNPQAPLDEHEQLFRLRVDMNYINRWQDNPRLFLYPSYAALDLPDFAGFGHLPIYPLGMMTTFALNADGDMMTPLQFFAHDLGHAASTAGWQLLDSPQMFDAVASRLMFRQLVLDGLPPALQELRPAITLILFHLFHEATAHWSRRTLGAGSFLPLLFRINSARRENRYNYSRAYRKISDRQALLACLWVYRAYVHCQRHSGTGALVEAGQLIARFCDQDRPALLAHWHLIETHRAEIQAFFLSGAKCTGSGKYKKFWYRSRQGNSHWYDMSTTLLLKTDYHGWAGGPVDNTDLAWFDNLLSDEMSKRLGTHLGVPVPADCF